MAQHDYNIADQPGASFLSDLNAALAAIVSQNSGATEPSPTYAYQLWADTTSGKLKMRNASNTGWLDIMTLADAKALSATNATTATKLQTARTITIGNTSKSFDGSANVSWSLDEIGVTAATETAAGIVELADVAEVQAGTDATRAVTPAGLASLTATETRAGIVALATAAEAQAGTDGTTALSPLRLRDALNASGSAPIYACRAWVNFNGIGTVAIRASGNVSSITDNGAGDYTVNFITAMPDANYCVTGSCCLGNSPYNSGGIVSEAASAANTFALKTANSVRIVTADNNTDSLFDTFSVNVAIFR